MRAWRGVAGWGLAWYTAWRHGELWIAEDRRLEFEDRVSWRLFGGKV